MFRSDDCQEAVADLAVMYGRVVDAERIRKALSAAGTATTAGIVSDDLFGKVRVGDVIRYRWATWPAGETVEREVFGISSRGSLLCRKPGQKSKFTLTKREVGDAHFELVEVIPKSLTKVATEEEENLNVV